MTPAEIALARSRAYGLFGKLLLDGQGIEAVPELGGGHPDRLAAIHHALFAFEVFPHEGVFLHESALVGGVDLEIRHRAMGFVARRRDTSADHLGMELSALSFLSGAEADALRDGVSVAAIREHQRAYLDGHLLRWLVPFAAAADDREAGPWTDLVALIVELAADHRAAIAVAAEPWTLPPAPAVLEDAKSSLNDIAEWLLTPCYSGIFLSRADLTTVGRATDVPRGFGSRRLMLANLLKQAATYDALGAVVARLDDLAARRDAHYERLGSRPGLAEAAAPWRKALERTRVLLATLGAASEKAS
jgi:putative dimethyl sulfoxide reductase chaperone